MVPRPSKYPTAALHDFWQNEGELHAHTILAGISEGLFACDLEWRVLYINTVAQHLLGIRPQDITDKNLWEILPDIFGTRLEEEYRSAAAGERRVVDFFCKRLNRRVRHSCSPLASGGIVVVLTDMEQDVIQDVVQDLSQERNQDDIRSADRTGQEGTFASAKRLESGQQYDSRKLLRHSDLRFHTLARSCADVLYRLNADWTEVLEFSSTKFVEEAQEPKDQWLEQFVHPEDQQKMKDAICKAIETSSPFELEHRVYRMDGTLVWIFSRAVPLFDDTGELIEWIGTAIDITDRKEMEAALRHSEAIERSKNAELEALFAAIPSPVWISYDPDCISIHGNHAGLELLGLTNREAANHAVNLPGEERFRYSVMRNGNSLKPQQMPMNLAIASGRAVLGDELQIVRADGSEKWIYANAVPLFSDEGAVRGCVCVAMDITKLKETEKARKASERKYHQLFAFTGDALFLYSDKTMQILEVNPAALRLYGFSAEEFIGMSVLELSSEPDKTRTNINARERGPVLRVHKKKDGSLFPAEVMANYFAMDGERLNIAAVRDITRRHRSEEKLQERTTHLQEVNAALKALLRQRDEDRREFEATIEANMKFLILPYLQNLKKSQLSNNQRTWLFLIESHLSKLTSSFTNKLSLAELNLSNAELKVASLVRDGKTTKEIADLLMIAPKTVSAHRDNIRRKLGFRGRKGSLRYLLLNLV